MSRVNRTLPLVLALVLPIVQWGCATRTTRPKDIDVQLSLSAAPAVGGPSKPVSIAFRVLNAGLQPVWHCAGCGCGIGIVLTVLGPDGAEVALSDPNAPRPLCADGFVPLSPGGVLEGMGSFTGTLYERGSPRIPSPTYPAPAGTYTVLVGFAYGRGGPGPGATVERKTTFVWEP